MTEKSAGLAEEDLPKALQSTRIAKRLGLTNMRAHLVSREIQRCLPDVRIESAKAKRLAVFPRLGVVYNRIQKNANTTTMLILDALEVGRIRSIPDSKGQHLLFYKAWASGRFTLENARYMVIVRSPYSRALSSFLFKFRFRQEAAMNIYGREFNITAQGFHDFLCWLRDGALSRDLHWDLQLHSLALPLAAFTDVIHIERYEAEMRAFLSATRLGSSPAVQQVDYQKFRRLGSPHAMRPHDKHEDFLTPGTRRLVAEIYAADFEAFGYPRD